MTGDRKPPSVAKNVTIPVSRKSKIDAIQSLTLAIQRLYRHFSDNPRAAHDGRSRKSLEIKHNQRGRLLAALLDQDTEAHRQVVDSLKINSEGGIQ